MRKSRTPPRRETARRGPRDFARGQRNSVRRIFPPISSLDPRSSPACRPRSAARRISPGKRLPDRRQNSANGTKYSCVRRAAAQCSPAHCRIVIIVPSGILLSFFSPFCLSPSLFPSSSSSLVETSIRLAPIGTRDSFRGTRGALQDALSSVDYTCSRGGTS